MDSRRPPEYNLDLTTDRAHIKDVVKGLLHTIFFHRYFTPLYPSTHEILDLTLPFVTTPDIESLIETRTATLLRHLDTTAAPSPSRPAFLILTLQFLERKRRRTWFLQKPDEETPWETWHINLTVLSSSPSTTRGNNNNNDYPDARARALNSHSLSQAVWSVLEIANQQRNHIPPITTNESNPFPYDLKVKVAAAGSGGKGGMVTLASGGGGGGGAGVGEKSGGGGGGGGGLGERSGQEGWGGKMGIF